MSYSAIMSASCAVKNKEIDPEKNTKRKGKFEILQKNKEEEYE
jgi:hypothetical protein